MAELVYKSSLMTYANTGSSVIGAGTPIATGNTFGVMICDCQPGEKGTLALDGTWRFPIANTETAGLGALAYWDASNSKITATASTNLQVGSFVEAVTSGQSECVVTIFNTGIKASGSE